MRRLLVPLIGFALIAGCAATIHDASSVGYVANGFSPAGLRQEGLALLPVVAGQGQEGYRRPMADKLSLYGGKAIVEGRFLDWHETMDRLNEVDLADSYHDMIATYRETAILRKEVSRKLGAALGVRYLLFVSLEQFHKAKNTSYSIWTGYTTTNDAAVNAFCQVWDTSNGNVVWEGNAGASSSGGEMTYAKPYEEYAKVASRGLIARIFRIKERDAANWDR